MASEGKKQLNPDDLDVESLDMEQLEDVAGGTGNGNCYSCTCPPPDPGTGGDTIIFANRADAS